VFKCFQKEKRKKCRPGLKWSSKSQSETKGIQRRCELLLKMSSAEESYEDEYEEDEYSQSFGSEIGHADEVSARFDFSFNFYCSPFSVNHSLLVLICRLQSSKVTTTLRFSPGRPMYQRITELSVIRK
jgi:hypothetical protein